MNRPDFTHDPRFVEIVEGTREHFESLGFNLEFRCRANIARVRSGKTPVCYFRLVGEEVVCARTLRETGM